MGTFIWKETEASFYLLTLNISINLCEFKEIHKEDITRNRALRPSGAASRAASESKGPRRARREGKAAGPGRPRQTSGAYHVPRAKPAARHLRTAEEFKV